MRSTCGFCARSRQGAQVCVGRLHYCCPIAAITKTAARAMPRPAPISYHPTLDRISACVSAMWCSFRLARADFADNSIIAQTSPPHVPRAIDRLLCAQQCLPAFSLYRLRCGRGGVAPVLWRFCSLIAPSWPGPVPLQLHVALPRWQRICKLCCNCMQPFVHCAPSYVTSSFTPNQVLKSFIHA